MRLKSFLRKLKGFLAWRLRRVVRACREIRQGPRALQKRVENSEPVLLLIAWGLTEDEIALLVERVRLTDTMIRDFKPIFVTDNESFSAFRQNRYLFEYIPPEREWNKHDLDGTYADFRDSRLRNIVDMYKPSSIIAFDDTSRFDLLQRGILNPFIMPGE